MIDFTPAQRRLGLTADGIAGPMTYGALLAHIAGHHDDNMRGLGAGLAHWLPGTDIDESVQRLANFLGQCCHESGGFHYLREIWGPTTAQRGYEGRADLGNTQAGDGHRFLGRGLIQLTGRHNYETMGDKIGVDLAGNPGLAETPEIAVRTAAAFWNSRGLNTLADEGLEDRITLRINGGRTGIDERRRYVARAKEVLA